LKKRGAEILTECLVREGTEVMFGIPGGVLLRIFDALYDSPIKFILTRHEQGAAHAADGYARATGKIGVCLATSGPGATNLVTGIATAYMDSVPIVAITGQVVTKMIGNDAFQEADTTGITRPITKHNYLVKDVRDLARVIKEAFYLASTGRPGPVLIDIPKDVADTETEFIYPETVEIRSYRPNYTGHPQQIKRAADKIDTAQRPVLYAGGGVIISGATEELKYLAETAEIPVTTTLLGLGGFPGDHHLSLGMLGMHGTRYANYAIMESDLIIAVGARFDDRATGNVEKFAPQATIIHIDIDPAAIGKSIKVHIPIVGDAKNVLRELIKLVKPQKHSEWLRQIDEWKRKYPLTYNQNNDGDVKPQFVVEQIWKATRGKAIITTEVGQNQMWTAQFYRFIEPRTLISSGGLGTMGYGFPAAIGAQVGRPDKVVIDIAGDGSFQMNIQELATAVKNNIPVKVAILDNGFLGMVRQWQELFYNRRYSHSRLTGNPDFVKVAEAYGAVGLRVTRPEEVMPTIEKALAIPRPVVIDFVVSPEENVFPIVPAGAGIDEMIGGLA